MLLYYPLPVSCHVASLVELLMLATAATAAANVANTNHQPPTTNLRSFGGGATPKPGKGSKKKGKAASTQTKSASDVDAMKAALGESGLITLGKEWSGFQFAGNVRPGPQTPMRTTPAGIAVPDYAQDGVPKTKGPRMPWQVEVKTPEDIEGMRAAGRVAREVLDAAGRMVKPGIATDAIDQLVHEEGVKRGAYPSPLNYHNFPKSVCTSINEVTRCLPQEGG